MSAVELRRSSRVDVEGGNGDKAIGAAIGRFIHDIEMSNLYIHAFSVVYITPKIWSYLT